MHPADLHTPSSSLQWTQQVKPCTGLLRMCVERHILLYAMSTESKTVVEAFLGARHVLDPFLSEWWQGRP